MSQYWPTPRTPQAFFVEFEKFIHKYTQVGHNLWRLDEFYGGVWKDSWYYCFRDGGVVEVADDYPKKGWQKLFFFFPTWYVGLKQPIQWGGKVNVGSFIDAPCETIGFLGVNQHGRQYLQVKDLIPKFKIGGVEVNDVVALYNEQTWGNKTTKSNWYLAPGKGFVYIEWIDPVHGWTDPQYVTSMWWGKNTDYQHGRRDDE